MNIRSLILLGLLAAAGDVRAEQGCPDGLYPGGHSSGQLCIPLPGYGVNGNSKPADTAPSDTPQAIKREYKAWAAIAHDPVKRSLGMAGQDNGISEKKEAEQAAIEACRGNGGGAGCAILLSYRSECAAIAVGMGADGNAALFADKGGSEERALATALARCAKSAQMCQKLNSNCVTGSFHFDGWR
jgi:hypothetical protein